VVWPVLPLAAGVITFSDLDADTHLSSARRLDRVGLVFQFPERHFLGNTMLQELTFGWPQSPESFPKRRQLVWSPCGPRVVPVWYPCAPCVLPVCSPCAPRVLPVCSPCAPRIPGL
jgi:hypothetical protein